MARPYKGDRMLVTSRLPRGYFDKLTRITAATGQTKLDFVADAVMKEIDSIDVDALEGQDPLPLSA